MSVNKYNNLNFRFEYQSSCCQSTFSLILMESENQFLTEAAEVAEKAQNIYKTNRKVLEDDREHLKKIYSNFSSACDYLTQEMKEGVKSMENVLRIAAQDDESSKLDNLLECLEEVSNKSTNLSIIEEKQKLLTDAQRVP